MNIEMRYQSIALVLEPIDPELTVRHGIRRSPPDARSRTREIRLGIGRTDTREARSDPRFDAASRIAERRAYLIPPPRAPRPDRA